MSSPATPFLANLLLFIHTLRQAGLPVSVNQSIDLGRALELIDIGQRSQVYWTTRSLLVSRKEDLALFDRLFDLFWRAPGVGPPEPQKAPRHRPHQRLNLATLLAQKARAEDPAVDLADKAGSFSTTEILQAREFAQMTPEELERVKKLIETMRWRISRRQTRRQAPDRQGSYLHLRRVLRSCVQHGGVPLHLAWKSRRWKPRPIILLADISGSMEKYSRLLLQFAYAVTRGLARVECFVFGTRLTRITPQLRVKNIDRALNDAAGSVVDWSGGTRIGESLAAFNREWSRQVLGRGAVVLIISDGWERGDVSLLAREMRYLQHRCHRLIWLNPLLGRATYQPLVEGMAAALPYIDDFLPIHNLQSLEALGKHLAELE